MPLYTWVAFLYLFFTSVCFCVTTLALGPSFGDKINEFKVLCHYRKRGSASYIVREVLSVRERERERERDTERDGSDVTNVALKLAMNLHFPLPKIRTIGDELALSLAKNSHFSFLPSHFPSLPSRRGHHCGAEIRNEFTFSIAKKFPILFFPSKKWIKLIPKTIGNRKRDCAWGGLGDKPYLRKSTDRKAQIRKAFVQFSGLICALRSVDFLR